MDQIFRSVAHFLTYQGIDLHRHQIRDLYFGTMKDQQQASSEEYPEFDAVAIWRSILETHATEFTRALPPGKLEQMPLDEVLEAARQQGVSNLDEIRYAVLEASGRISIIKRETYDG